MRTLHPLIILTLFLIPVQPADAQDLDGRIYGRITTRSGEQFEGLIRWDKNEVSWTDQLDGSKVMEPYASRDEGRTVKIFGVTIYDESVFSSTRSSGIRFGHIESIENIGRNEALLTLKSGDVIEFRGGSSDLGSDLRELILEDERNGVVEFKWQDFERVEFMPAPSGIVSQFGDRLYGTMTTRQGDAFTGYVCWDVDEVLGEDVLDGTDENGRKRRLKFREISLIARNSSRSALVILNNGDELVLSGSNDVNGENRGILIQDPAMGQVRITWNDFEELAFQPPPAPMRYKDFVSAPLSGTVYTRDGEELRGWIRWDNDEAATWEILNGEMDDLEFHVEFGMISEIERVSSRAARVTLRDGRMYQLRNSNDVNEENDGIFVAVDADDEYEIRWDEFERVVFEKP